ncbi:UNVERIFIED_CONTAM: hypothetical protein FKN15_056237 [Acipenser sinensis]
MNTRFPPKRVPSAAHFFTLCRLTVQPPQSYSVGGQRSSGQLTGKPGQTTGVAGARFPFKSKTTTKHVWDIPALEVGNAELSISELPKAPSWDDALSPAYRGYKPITHRKISLFFLLKTVGRLERVRKPETGDRRPETGDRRPETGDRRPETGPGQQGAAGLSGRDTEKERKKER